MNLRSGVINGDATMLFDVSNFYLYQSMTIEFYMILSTFYPSPGKVKHFSNLLNPSVTNKPLKSSKSVNSDKSEEFERSDEETIECRDDI